MPSGRIWEDEESEEILWTVVGIFTVSGLVLIIHALLIHCGGTACKPIYPEKYNPVAIIPCFVSSVHVLI